MDLTKLDRIPTMEELTKLPLPVLQALAIKAKSLPTHPNFLAAQIKRDDPRDFIRDVLGWTPTPSALKHGYTNPWTPDQDRIMQSVVDHKFTVVQSAHGVGKSRIAAALILWWLMRYKPSKVITTSVGWEQVADVLWAEVRTVFGESKVKLPGRMLMLELELGPDHYAKGLSTKPHQGDFSATSLHGKHSPNMMVVMDEATGIEDAVIRACLSLALRPTDKVVALLNPTDPGSPFKKICEDGVWNLVQIDGMMHPNVLHDDPDIIVGAITKPWVDEEREMVGENSPLWMSRVKGLWPTQASNSLIDYEWIRAAKQRGAERAYEIAQGRIPESDGRGIALGLDVAAEGGDLTVLSMIQDGVWFIPRVNGKPAWHIGRDVGTATDLALACIKEYPGIRTLTVDDSGVGNSVSSSLRRVGRDGGLPEFIFSETGDQAHRQEKNTLTVVPVNFGARAWLNEKFHLKKDQLWWQGREALREGKIAFPSDQELTKYNMPKGNDFCAQLQATLYDSSGHLGRIVVYDKKGAGGSGAVEKTKHLPSKSPDIAHSFLLALHGWMRLRSGKVIEPTKTIQEARSAEFKKNIERMVAKAQEDVGMKPSERFKYV